MPDPNDGCFAGGTLVHTRDGLKPIEQIRIGDWVLSQPEMGGEKAYKRVTQTFRHEEQDVQFLTCSSKDAWVKAAQAVFKDGALAGEPVYGYLVTANHTFWVKENGPDLFCFYKQNPSLDTRKRGWVRVDELSTYDELELFDDRIFLFKNAQQIRKTEHPGIGFMPIDPRYPDGHFIEIHDGKFKYEFGCRRAGTNEGLGFEWWDSQGNFKCTVYNLDVEDFHTYYVGEIGVWVHNKPCSLG